MQITILPYRAEWAVHFERLNKDWLEEFFYVEPFDKYVLENPQESIIDKAGEIWFAVDGEKVIGTVALMQAETGVLEMTKMAVEKKHRERGAGILLVNISKERAKSLGADTLMLYSNTKLVPAINLYRKVGFFEREMDNAHYERANIKMEMPLRDVPALSEIKGWVEGYGSSYGKLKNLLASIPKEIWNWQPPDNKWTIHQNIIHLADSEAISYLRGRTTIATSGESVITTDPDVWVHKLHYNKQSSQKALELYEMLRESTYNLLKILPDDVWDNYMIHPNKGKVKLWQWLEYFENHTHMGQIKRVYQAWQKSH